MPRVWMSPVKPSRAASRHQRISLLHDGSMEVRRDGRFRRVPSFFSVTGLTAGLNARSKARPSNGHNGFEHHPTKGSALHRDHAPLALHDVA